VFRRSERLPPEVVIPRFLGGLRGRLLPIVLSSRIVGQRRRRQWPAASSSPTCAVGIASIAGLLPTSLAQIGSRNAHAVARGLAESHFTDDRVPKPSARSGWRLCTRSFPQASDRSRSEYANSLHPDRGATPERVCFLFNETVPDWNSVRARRSWSICRAMPFR
jgi:hypothetical protein